MDTTSRKPYPSDLTDAQWAIIEPLLPPPVLAGAPWKTQFREVVNAIDYVLTMSCAWKALPYDFLTPRGNGPGRFSPRASPWALAADS